MIEKERKIFEDDVKAAMSSVANICLTADMWSTSHRSWIGMTAHWLDDKTITRKSAALCCKRIHGIFRTKYLNCTFQYKKTNIF